MHSCRRLGSLPCLGRLVRFLHLDPVFLAILPPTALTFDYSMTFFLARGHEYVLASEASPVIRFALENNLMVAYFLALLVSYFLITQGILRFPRGTPPTGSGCPSSSSSAWPTCPGGSLDRQGSSLPLWP